MLSSILRRGALLLAIAATAPAMAQTTVTLRNGVNGASAQDTDAAASWATTNHGTLQQYSQNWNTSTAFIRFNIFVAEGGPVPNGATITSATLSVYQASGPGSTFEARRLLKNWQEMQATWNDAATGLPWQTPGALGSADIAGAADGQSTISIIPGWLNIDVTSGVQAFASGTANYGWRLGWLSGTTGAKTFWSSNYVADTSLRPALTITYTDPVGGGGTEYPSPLGASGVAIPTFHSMGLYYNPSPAPTNGKVFVRYRKATDNPATPGVWKQGYPMWFDPRTTGNALPYAYRARGSVVHLQPGTKYVFEVGTGDDYGSTTWSNHIPGQTAGESMPATWAETFPEGTTETIASRTPAQGPLVITQPGTASAYRVYDGANGASKNVIDRTGAGLGDGPTQSHDQIDGDHLGVGADDFKDPSFGIVIKASYVIVRRIVVKGAAAAGIVIYPGVTNVVIEDTEVTEWSQRHGTTVNSPNCGDEGCREPTNPNTWGHWGMHEVGGIHLSGNNSRIVLQRNVIKDPFYGTFPWDTHPTTTCTHPIDHPRGPTGVTVYHGGEQNVIRYNEITGHATDDRRWLMDGMSGMVNFSAQGAPGADSDVYQNIVMRVFDDGIEAEGGGRNVRVWGNYLSDVKAAIGATTVHFGPTYVWRNVVNRMRTCYKSITNTDNDWFSTAFKYGGYDTYGGGYGEGIRYLFHNTLLQQPSSPADSLAEGAGRGVEGVSNGRGSVSWTIARNNIFHVRSDTNTTAWSVESYDSPVGSDFATNLYNGRWDTVHLTPPDAAFEFIGSELIYKPGHGWSSVPALGGGGTGNYQLDDGSKGKDMWGPSSSKSCEIVPNFSDGYIGAAPDCGAHENGAPPMKFGISAGQ